MGLRLTLILVAVIYLTMRFGGSPVEPTAQTEPPQPDPVEAPQTDTAEAVAERPVRAVLPVETIAATPDPEPPLPEPVAPVEEERLTLVAPESLAPERAPSDGFAPDPATLIAPIEALPEGLAGGPSLGLGGALDLRDQIDAALDEAGTLPERPSLANLAQPSAEEVPEPAPASTVPASSPVPAAPDANFAEVTATSVNLRGGPSTLNAVVGRVTAGDVLELRGEFSGGWRAVRHPDTGDTAYISEQFLSPIN